MWLRAAAETRWIVPESFLKGRELEQRDAEDYIDYYASPEKRLRVYQKDGRKVWIEVKEGRKVRHEPTSEDQVQAYILMASPRLMVSKQGLGYIQNVYFERVNGKLQAEAEGAIPDWIPKDWQPVGTIAEQFGLT